MEDDDLMEIYFKGKQIDGN